MPIRILLVDDHELVREGLTAMLAATSGMTVVGAAATGGGALRLARDLRPDVVLMDKVIAVNFESDL
jgi:DNA-binding NarL/FixJ family response regulator